MKTKGVNRVAIAVKDLDKAVALYSRLLNTTFHTLAMAEASGVRVAFSWDAGVEIASPIPGSTAPSALGLAQHINKHGEGLYAVIFSVDNAEQAKAKAEEMGIRVVKKVDVDQAEVKRSFHGNFSTFIEYFLHPEDTRGTQVVLGQFDTKK